MFKTFIFAMINSIICVNSLRYRRDLNCSSEPPERPVQGTMIWSGDYRVSTKIIYTCGPYGQFLGKDGSLYPQFEVKCLRNRAWSPSVLDPCVMTSCGTMPVPPGDSDLVLTSGPQLSDGLLFYPSLPAVVRGIPIGLCDEEAMKIMIVGKILDDAHDDLNVVVNGDNSNEAVHLRISVRKKSIRMWSIVDSSKGTFGDFMNHNSMTINFNEYFVIK